MIKQNKFEKIRKKYEKKMTKAYLKNQKDKFKILKTEFRKIFRDSQMFLTSEEGCAFNISYRLPKTNKEKFQIIIDQGEIFTEEEIIKQVEEVQPYDWQEVFEI